MGKNQSVCIRCSTGVKLEKLPIDVYGKVVGMMFCCDRCLEILKDHNLEIYIYRNEGSQEPRLERVDGSVCYH